MKKNKLMRLASVLLVLTLLTTCVIGGTYAKYITSDSAKDVARVAKFGVVASISGDLFGPSYSGQTSGNKIQTWAVDAATVSVSTGTENVVAPGTVGDTMTFTVKGTPEVSTEVHFGTYRGNGVTDLKYYAAEPQLTAGTYGVMVPAPAASVDPNEVVKADSKYYTYDSTTAKFTQCSATSTFNSATPYYELHDAATIEGSYFPITWMYEVGEPLTGSTIPNNSLKTAIEAIEAGFKPSGTDATFAPNTSNNLSASLTWAWYFEGGLGDTSNVPVTVPNIYSEQDKADTILGDMIAATNAGALNTDQYVVKAATTAGQFDVVKTASVKIMSDSAVDNMVTVAYTGTLAENTPAYTTELTALSSGICAVLGVAFDASLTVQQVD